MYPRTTAIRIVATVAAGLVVIGATAFSSRSPAPTSLRENKALEHGERGGTPLAAGAMRAIDGGDVVAAAAPGWAGEIQIGADDTWEPSIAADPTGPYVYAMYNGFNRPKACKSCPPIPMLLRVSSDNGVTWGPETYPCPCPGVKQFQYDPVMRVAGNGVVYATWMNKYDIVFSKSSNHGATWTAPIEVSGQPWADKPWIGVSPNGTDVYIGFATSSDVWIAASHNAGASFAPAVNLNDDMSQYRYPNGFEVLPSGVAVMSASKYPGASSQTAGAIEIETWRTTNGGASWSRTVIGNVFSGVDFSTSSTTALASDAAGTLVAMYTGATTQGGSGHVWTRRSTDGGLTWAPAVEIGNGSANASFPAITGGAAGDFRLHYADDRTGAWNTWYRTSTTGGATWSVETDISDADGGASYKSPAGFADAYGDYGQIDITNTGKTVAAWGEGVDISTGPGGIWFNRSL